MPSFLGMLSHSFLLSPFRNKTMINSEAVGKLRQIRAVIADQGYSNSGFHGEAYRSHLPIFGSKLERKV